MAYTMGQLEKPPASTAQTATRPAASAPSLLPLGKPTYSIDNSIPIPVGRSQIASIYAEEATVMIRLDLDQSVLIPWGAGTKFASMTPQRMMSVLANQSRKAGKERKFIFRQWPTEKPTGVRVWRTL